MDRRFHARMPPASRHERCCTFPGSASLRASPLRGQRDVLQHRSQLLLVGEAVEPPVETASAQLRILHPADYTHLSLDFIYRVAASL